MKKLIYTLPLLLALGACSNEEGFSPEPNIPDGQQSYYFTMDFSVPNDLANTRAASVDGSHVLGSEAEYTINNIHLYLLDADGNGTNTKDEVLWAKTDATGVTLTPADGDVNIDQKYGVKIKLEQTDLTAIEKLKGHNVKILVLCNTPQYTGYTPLTVGSVLNKDQFTLGWSTANTPLGEYGTAGKNMPMANEHFNTTNITDFNSLSQTGNDLKAAIRGLFKLENGEFIYNLTPSTATSIDVERAVARLDIKANGTSWIYTMEDGDKGATQIKLGLHEITPLNLNGKSYVIRHGAAAGDGMAANTVSYFGDVTGGWVADPSWETWTDGTGWSKSTTNLFNKLEKTGQNTYYTRVTNYVGAKEVSGNNGLVNGTPENNKYYPWCYVPENTIPSNTLMSNVANAENLPLYATGVYFRFKVLKKNATSLTDVVTNETEAEDLPEGASIDDEGNLTLILSESAKYQTFSYNSSDGCYYVDYIGYITHNTTSSAPMNYAVVRNTVYQMSVNSIKNLPAPNDAIYYLTLDINVLSWNKVDVGFDF